MAGSDHTASPSLESLSSSPLLLLLILSLLLLLAHQGLHVLLRQPWARDLLLALVPLLRPSPLRQSNGPPPLGGTGTTSSYSTDNDEDGRFNTQTSEGLAATTRRRTQTLPPREALAGSSSCSSSSHPSSSLVASASLAASISPAASTSLAFAANSTASTAAGTAARAAARAADLLLARLLATLAQTMPTGFGPTRRPRSCVPRWWEWAGGHDVAMLCLSNADVDIARASKSSLLYGELLPAGLRRALSPTWLDAASAQTFVDLGSGLGKVVMQAFAEYPESLSRVVGIELSPARHREAVGALRAQTVCKDGDGDGGGDGDCDGDGGDSGDGGDVTTTLSEVGPDGYRHTHVQLTVGGGGKVDPRRVGGGGGSGSRGRSRLSRKGEGSEGGNGGRELHLLEGSFFDVAAGGHGAEGGNMAYLRSVLCDADIVFLQVAIPPESWPQLRRLLGLLPLGCRILSFVDLSVVLGAASGEGAAAAAAATTTTTAAASTIATPPISAEEMDGRGGERAIVPHLGTPGTPGAHDQLPPVFETSWTVHKPGGGHAFHLYTVAITS